MNKKFWAATFTLTGTIIGAGILGLPYVFSESGFLAGLFWLITLGAVMIFVNLALGEITLRTKGKHQLSGYAEKYLGKWGKRLMFFAMIFGVYSALLAYLVGEGESLSSLIPGNIHPLIFGIGFWLIMTLLLREGLRELKKIETWGVIAIISIISWIFVKSFHLIKPSNLMNWDAGKFAIPIGVVLFALLGFTSIPELREELRGKEKSLKNAIILGTLIPIILYTIFSGVFIGALGTSVKEIATLSFGPLMTILGIFTMLTSFFVLSFSLRDSCKYDLGLSDRNTFLITSLVPLTLYLAISQFKFIGFTLILSIGGVMSGGLTAILILLMLKRAKKQTQRNKNPGIQVPINWILILILSTIFIFGMILEYLY
jgi:tyrosine-specific transport protein